MIFRALLVSLLLINAVSAEENYCRDQSVNWQWADMLTETPDDPLIIKLVALRFGLCVLVDQGLIALNRATEIFEQERSEAIAERRQDEQQRRSPLPNSATTQIRVILRDKDLEIGRDRSYLYP